MGKRKTRFAIYNCDTPENVVEAARSIEEIFEDECKMVSNNIKKCSECRHINLCLKISVVNALKK